MKKKITFFVSVIIFTLCFSGCVHDSSAISKNNMKPHLVTISANTNADKVIKQCIPSVVAVRATNSDYESVGSGVCVADGGLIVTNSHVVSGAEKINLFLADGTTTKADILWKDKSLDLALLRSKKSIPWLKIAEAGSYSVGEDVISIGTPMDLNFRHSVTKGVISALNRTVQVDNNGYSSLSNLLQHDASINPGNSGGPLINMRGEIIGINTIKVSDAEGMGFAIVCDTITPVIADYTKGNDHENGYLGIFGYDISLETFGGSEYGLKIVSIAPDSPLCEYDIKEGSVILSADGKKVSDYLMLKKYLYTRRAGETISVEILSDGKNHTYDITLVSHDYND